MAPKHDLEAYRRFAENLPAALSGRNVRDITLRKARKEALPHGTRTKYGSYAWKSAVSSRMGMKTTYLGSEPVRQAWLNDYQEQCIDNAPEMLHKVLQLVQTLPMVHLRRRMGDNPDFNPQCNLYTSVADPKNWRLPYAWGNTLFDPARNRPGPELTMIHIPDEHPLRMQILSLPDHNINIALGSDYTGEEKKGFLRQAMYLADAQGMLGLHAGTKIVVARDKQSGELKRHGVFLFGLTATGKSTWSCHQLGLDHDDDEDTLAVQDDICFLRRDGSAYGSENNFYVKTDVSAEYQEAMYNALTDESAILENLMVKADGSLDFLDERLGANGRGIMNRYKLKVRRGRRMHCITADSVNLPPLGEGLDSVAFAFITRRNTIMPFAQELTPEQAVLAYLFGESTHSFATRPAQAGESVRTVGTDPFIIGSHGKKVNQFFEIIMGLCERCPGQVRFYQYNTGGMGEVITRDAQGNKLMVRKVERVPLDLMAAIQRGDLRGTNSYEQGRLGTREIVGVEGVDLSHWRTSNFYTDSEIEAYVQDLVQGRREHLEKIAATGLNPEIIKMAERSFEGIAPRGKQVAIPREITEPPEGDPPLPDELQVGRAGTTLQAPSTGRSAWISSWEPRRPPRPLGRWK
jgi:phosphoenolpyruvate carboxykinase (ATP)